jgi:hypothetical protein
MISLEGRIGFEWRGFEGRRRSTDNITSPETFQQKPK